MQLSSDIVEGTLLKGGEGKGVDEISSHVVEQVLKVDFFPPC